MSSPETCHAAQVQTDICSTTRKCSQQMAASVFALETSIVPECLQHVKVSYSNISAPLGQTLSMQRQWPVHLTHYHCVNFKSCSCSEAGRPARTCIQLAPKSQNKVDCLCVWECNDDLNWHLSKQNSHFAAHTLAHHTASCNPNLESDGQPSDFQSVSLPTADSRPLSCNMTQHALCLLGPMCNTCKVPCILPSPLGSLSMGRIISELKT